jgi:hypothetical protein
MSTNSTSVSENTDYSKYIIYGGFISVIITICISYGFLLSFTGSKDNIDDYNTAKKNIMITCFVCGGLLYGTVLLYIFNNKQYAMYILLFIAFLALTLSYISVSLCAINKN